MDEAKKPALSPDRDKVIVRTSVIGVLTNVALASFKAVVGLLSNSIAVLLDAVNNFSDALSSVITIIGAKLAGKAPTKKHPLGYGRIEYLTAMIVSAIVLYAGVTALVESVKKIISPEEADYSTVSLIIIAVAVVVKLILGLYVRRRGRAVDSGALVASGSDALFDAILSSSVLACALIARFTSLSLEAYVGVLISLVIIRAGVGMMAETVSDILGQRADADTAKTVKSILSSLPGVRGAYDLVLNNYGPNKNYGSVHLEVPDGMTAKEIDRLTRRAEAEVYAATGIILTGIGIYSFNTGSDEAATLREKVKAIVLAHPFALQVHGFYADPDEKTMRFDVVIGFDADRAEALSTMMREVGEAFPDYTVRITPDVDVSD
jgi:cation diffusion facilitator family transporter